MILVNSKEDAKLGCYITIITFELALSKTRHRVSCFTRDVVFRQLCDFV